MKLKNLFLTSLVALALGACSNASEEATTTDVTAQKSAILQLNLGFVNSNSTRAVTGETTKGSLDESNVKTIDVRVHYIGNTAPDVTAQFTSDGTNKWTMEAEQNQVIPYSLSQIKVYPGKAQVYVTVNNTNTAATSNVVTPPDYTALDGLSTSLAKPQEFVMTGTSEEYTIAANQVNALPTINVNRVTAKLQETSATSFDITSTIKVVAADGTVTDYKPQTDNKLTVTFLNYSFMNLAKTTNLFYNSTFATTQYHFPLLVNNDGSESFPTAFKAMGGDKSTYCLENNSTTNKTYVVYEAQMNGGNNFYVAKKGGQVYLYLSFDALDKANGGAYSVANHLTDASTIDEFYTAGVIKYAAGKMYYKHAISTTTSGTASDMIARNNWYILNINQVNNLGGNLVDPKDTPDEQTWLTMTINVMPWTYQVNSFDL
jgi:hypothetical protein